MRDDAREKLMKWILHCCIHYFSLLREDVEPYFLGRESRPAVTGESCAKYRDWWISKWWPQSIKLTWVHVWTQVTGPPARHRSKWKTYFTSWVFFIMKLCLGLPPIGHNDHGVPRRNAFSVVFLVLHFYLQKEMNEMRIWSRLKAFEEEVMVGNPGNPQPWLLYDDG